LLLAASDLGMRLVYYDAALEWAMRGRAMVDPAATPEVHGKLTRNVLFALLSLGRHDAVEALCRSALSQPSDPALQAHAAYAMAMLNARYYDLPRRDYDAARGWVARAIALSDGLPPSATAAVNRAFLMNAMALVEMRIGRDAAALDLLDGALRALARDAPERYSCECGILHHNRARLHIAGKRSAEAIGALTEMLSADPSDSEAYFDRGLLQQRAGNHQAALADYERAIRWSPPYWEPHFNRGQVLTALARFDAAVAEYDRVLVLHPEHLEALINRGSLLLALDRLGEAERDANRALRIDGANARALCLRGLPAIRRGDLEAADRDLSAAIAADPRLADAWANRATVRFRQGEPEEALRDLDQALARRDDPEIRFNRGRILESLDRRREAIADYRRALSLGASAPEAIQRRLDHCLADDQDPHGQPATPAV